MNFLFGKKYPIFNKEGKIQHRRDLFFKEWKERYTQDSNKNWKNHSGRAFQNKK
ncbi:MAG: hypothetical protein ACR2M7_05325 [Bdellovibrionales bacterium]